jgi:hypothetical protein
VILLILNFLPKQFNVLIKILINRQNLPSFEELKAILINDKLHIKFDETPMKKLCSLKGKAFPQIPRIMTNNFQSKKRKDESKKCWKQSNNYLGASKGAKKDHNKRTKEHISKPN